VDAWRRLQVRGRQWPLPRVTAALQAAWENPDLGGPLTLRRIPAETYTVAPRPDALTSRQRHAITSIAQSRDTLTDEQATILLAALAFGRTPRYASFREGRQHTEHTLKETGLLRSYHGPHHTEVSKDVRFSLRYSDDRHITAEH